MMAMKTKKRPSITAHIATRSGRAEICAAAGERRRGAVGCPLIFTVRRPVTGSRGGGSSTSRRSGLALRLCSGYAR